MSSVLALAFSVNKNNMTASDVTESMRVSVPSEAEASECSAPTSNDSVGSTDSLGFEAPEGDESEAQEDEPVVENDSVGSTDSMGFEGPPEQEPEPENVDAPSLYPDDCPPEVPLQIQQEGATGNLEHLQGPYRSPLYYTGEYKPELELERSSSHPLTMLRKSATAIVGGTMVGVGLVMIPLPTPCGCVVASSGMALLGTEFKGAKEMNDKILDKSKKGFVKARSTMINKIESMNSDLSSSEEEESDTETDKEAEQAPKWLHMNPAERKRQEKITKEQYRRENQSSADQVKEKLTKSTGSYLSRTLVPFLKRSKKYIEDPEEEEVNFEHLGDPKLEEEKLDIHEVDAEVHPEVSPERSGETGDQGEEEKHTNNTESIIDNEERLAAERDLDQLIASI